MNPTEQNPSGSQQQRTDQPTQSTTGGQYNQARQYSSSGTGQTGQYGQGSQYGQGRSRYSGGRGWQEEGNWMTGKVGLYSALAAGSVGALAYLLINREGHGRAGDLLSEGVERLQGRAHRAAGQLRSGIRERMQERMHGEKSGWKEMEARDVMTDAPAVCTPDTRLDKVASIMEDCDCGAIPVVDNKANRKAIGMVTDRDIVVRALAEGKNPLEMTARDVMTTDVVSVRQDATLDEVAEKMQDHQVRRVIVADRNGRCKGIISQADLARYAPKQEIGEMVREVSEPAGGVLSGLTR